MRGDAGGALVLGGGGAQSRVVLLPRDGFCRVSDGTFSLTFEGNFMMIPPLVGLDLDAISWHLAYLIYPPYGFKQS